MGEVGQTEDTPVYVLAQLVPVEFSCSKSLSPSLRYDLHSTKLLELS